MPDVTYALCDSIFDYAQLSASLTYPVELIPVIKWNEPCHSDGFRTECAPLGHRGVDWRGLAEQIVLARNAPPRFDAAVIEAVAGPAAVCAAYLAAATCRQFRLVNQLSDIMGASDGSSDHIIVVTLDQAEDCFLFGLLDRLEGALRSHMPWSALPRHTLLVARNVASLSWLTAKLVKTAGHTRKDPVRLRHYSPSESSTAVTELALEQEQFTCYRNNMAAPELLVSYRDAANVIAVSTHGSESCARGGDGTVLCGLQHDGTPFAPRLEGVLACGRGYKCPRGPYPVPLLQMATDVLMLATCNGLRLANSRYQAQFSFGLSFVDGTGLGFVSSIFASVGGDPASLAFLAAMSEGCTLAEATALINAFVLFSGFEKPCFVAIGDSEYRVRLAPPTAGHSFDLLPEKLDLGQSRFATLQVIDPALVELASHRQLTLSIIPDQAPPTGMQTVLAFHRVESLADGNKCLRVFFFRFPNGLGRVRIRAIDPHAVRERARTSLRDLRAWLDTSRLVGLDAVVPNNFDELRRSLDHLELSVGRSLALLGQDGEIFQHLESQLSVAQRWAVMARDEVLEYIAPQLEGPFWLTNVHASYHALEQIHSTSCPYCGSQALGRVVRHVLLDTKRKVVVCPRCGIGMDVPIGSAVEDIVIDAPKMAAAGHSLALTVSIRLTRPSHLRVFSRLTTRDETVSQPTPESYCLCAAGAARLQQFRFLFELPATLSPHRYYVKVIAGWEGGLSFAARPFFVFEGRYHNESSSVSSDPVISLANGGTNAIPHKS